jgi:hypothetical protein
MRWRSLLVAPVLAALAAGAWIAVRPSGGGAVPAPPSVGVEASRWRGLVGAPRVQAAVGQRVLVVLRAPSLAERVAAAGGRASDGDERHWSASAFAAQQQLLSDLERKGVQIKPDFRYTRTINGFSALLDARAVALLERTPGVDGIYPVRAAYPASVSRSVLFGGAAGAWRAQTASLGTFAGSGVTIALLDTGVDLRKPYLHGHVLDGVDLVSSGADAAARAKPSDPAVVETHGTEMAGLLVGEGGPDGLNGVAPAATLLPIRVAGWQASLSGDWAVYARTDQILAGLEHAVDPNGDGDAHDAARVILIPLDEPFGAFADSPLARAVQGAQRLDSLVVVPAGNDGPAGPAFGSVGGPGGAAAALTVGALDGRPAMPDVRLVARTGLSVVLDRVVPLAGAVAPRQPLVLRVAGPRRGGRFYDRTSVSTVAGKAVVAPAGADPAATARAAVRAGAAAVLLYGQDLPPGALGLDEGVSVPVLSIPAAAAPTLLAHPAEVALSQRPAGRGAHGLAPFSSWGLAFDGSVKPEVVAPGVGAVTAEPGVNADGTPAFGTVTGTSAAAAVTAGAAALLFEARPGLSAPLARSLLVGTASAVRGPAAGRGAGAVDVQAAAAAEVAAIPATISFGRGGGDGWTGEQTLRLRNVSTRPVTVFVGDSRGGRGPLAVTVRPRRVQLEPGGAAEVEVSARVTQYPGAGAVLGALAVTVLGGRTTRVPWSAVVPPRTTAAPELLGALKLDATRTRPTERAPAVLTFRAGRVAEGATGAVAVEPVLRLDLVLENAAGREIGVLARLRDLLPGRYAFGVTGRGPAGRVLPSGTYRLRLVAWPTGGGNPTVGSIRFAIR